MAYDSKAVANAFLDIAEAHGQTITPMKLQKLVFFAHGWDLALHDEPLIDEEFEAWDFGPVAPGLYREFRSAGSGAITTRATDVDWGKSEIIEPTLPASDKRTLELLDEVWKRYGGMSAIELSNLTHRPGTPWAIAKQRAPAARNVVLDDDKIRAYFTSIADRN